MNVNLLKSMPFLLFLVLSCKNLLAQNCDALINDLKIVGTAAHNHCLTPLNFVPDVPPEINIDCPNDDVPDAIDAAYKQKFYEPEAPILNAIVEKWKICSENCKDKKYDQNDYVHTIFQEIFNREFKKAQILVQLYGNEPKYFYVVCRTILFAGRQAASLACDDEATLFLDLARRLSESCFLKLTDKIKLDHDYRAVGMYLPLLKACTQLGSDVCSNTDILQFLLDVFQFDFIMEIDLKSYRENEDNGNIENEYKFKIHGGAKLTLDKDFLANKHNFLFIPQDFYFEYIDRKFNPTGTKAVDFLSPTTAQLPFYIMIKPGCTKRNSNANYEPEVVIEFDELAPKYESYLGKCLKKDPDDCKCTNPGKPYSNLMPDGQNEIIEKFENCDMKYTHTLGHAAELIRNALAEIIERTALDQANDMKKVQTPMLKHVPVTPNMKEMEEYMKLIEKTQKMAKSVPRVRLEPVLRNKDVNAVDYTFITPQSIIDDRKVEMKLNIKLIHKPK
ncbi:MAG: hypothetical protein NT007_03970 [Candidatus Kapabacteria bacterium]|nr:hypothetical protein [Candidatus Kapabacteria bacterium]